MTDLSTPPPSTLAKATRTAFRWPTPPYATYPAPAEQSGGEPCEIEGVNGKSIRGRLVFFVPEELVAHVQVPPSRTTVPLHFNQFRTLTLLEPLAPREELADGPRAEALRERPHSNYSMTWADGDEVEGTSIGHVESQVGVFLFHPIDGADSVRRVFVPRTAYRAFEFGSALGALLLDSRAATLDQIERATTEQQRLRDQKLGDILVVKQAVTREQLVLALEQQSKMPMMRIGEALMGLGLIDRPQLDAALETQKSDRSVPLGEIMVRLGLVSRQDLQTALSRKMGYPLVDVRQFPVEADALRRVASAVARRLHALPLMQRGANLVVAIDDPGRRSALEELEFVAQCKIVPVLAHHGDLEVALRQAYQKIGADAFGPGGDTEAVDPAAGLEFSEDAGKLLETLEREQHDRPRTEDDKQIEQSDNSLVRLINQMIMKAHAEGVSDIHIESHPGREKVKIRFRKDGVLHPYLELPHTYRQAMVARIKIMCDLDISERRKPQDGKINFSKFAPGYRVELRVATIPTYGSCEDVVLRLLASAKPIPLDGLGLSAHNLAALREASERPYGLVLCVGPTGSGKTTTLHSVLSHINVPERKIWTAEDPIEITQPGLRQVQVNPKIDWTFAKALRAFLRADPDVIMVGEIRDGETAQMAIEASLTGHLVLSTLHTNSAPETVTRLLDMGMDPFNFADSLLGVLAQRLVRKLCHHCRRTEPATDAQVDELMSDWLHAMGGDSPAERDALRAGWLQRHGREGRLMWHASPGCAHCNHTGFLGRVAIHELMVVTRDMRQLIQTRARVAELQRAGCAAGMRTLRQDGIEKVLAGLTSIEEVRSTSNA